MSSGNESATATGCVTTSPSVAADAAAVNGIVASGAPGVTGTPAAPGAAPAYTASAASGAALEAATAGTAPIAKHAAPATVPRGALLSFLAGYADTVGFVGLGGLFTAHVTGNFVLLGYALVAPVQGILPKLLAFPVFVLWIAVTRLLVARWQQRSQAALSHAMTMQALLLLAAAACAWLGGPITKPDAPIALACGMLCVAAMAAQNAYGKLLLPQMPATTVMTGNVTQLVIALMDARKAAGKAPGNTGAPPAAGPALANVAGGVLGFAAGACCGALMARWSLALALLAACLPLAPLAWQARRQS